MPLINIHFPTIPPGVFHHQSWLKSELYDELYAVWFSFTWFGRYLWNYWSVEVTPAGRQSGGFVCFCVLKSSRPTPIPRASLLCFSFQSTHKSLHWSQQSCENKNDPKLFEDHSGTVQCSICQGEATTDTRERDYNQWGKIYRVEKLSCCQHCQGKASPSPASLREGDYEELSNQAQAAVIPPLPLVPTVNQHFLSFFLSIFFCLALTW